MGCLDIRLFFAPHKELLWQVIENFCVVENVTK